MSTARHSRSVAPVVVGVDGSETSLTAVDLAAREAALRGRPLVVVHAFIWPLFHVSLGPPPLGPPEGGLRHHAERTVEQALARASAAEPTLAVTGEVTAGAPAPVLLNRSHSAALVVVGDRGLGGFTGLLVGSVAVQLAAHAACPVLVVRGTVDRPGPVVVGVDCSPSNDPALGYAFETAALHHVPLIAMYASQPPGPTGPRDMPATDNSAELQTDEATGLAEALASWGTKYPDVDVTHAVMHAETPKALVRASSKARVIVVGTRGRGGFAGLLLGSVSQALLHHAACPVAVVPESSAQQESHGGFQPLLPST